METVQPTTTINISLDQYKDDKSSKEAIKNGFYVDDYPEKH